MNYQLTFRTLLLVAAVAMSGLDLRADTCDSLVCGDADGNGTYDINDLTFVTSFLYDGGPAPAVCGDIDGYDLFTIRDIVVGATMQPANCVTQSKIVAQPSSQMMIWYNRLFSQGQSSETFPLGFTNFSTASIKAFDLPLAVRVDNQIPLSLSVDLSSSTWPDQDIVVKIDTAAGTILLSDLDGSVAPGNYTLCNITIQMPYSANTRYTRFDYALLAPFMTGVFEPPNSACHYPMFLDLNLDAWKPNLGTSCLCGDGNNTGRFTISDAVYILNAIFAAGELPFPPCLGDANGSATVNVSDVVYLINFIFNGGPEPHCP